VWVLDPLRRPLVLTLLLGMAPLETQESASAECQICLDTNSLVDSRVLEELSAPCRCKALEQQLATVHEALTTACQAAEEEKQRCERLREQVTSGESTSPCFQKDGDHFQQELTVAHALARASQLQVVAAEKLAAQREKDLQDTCSEWRQMVLEAQQRQVELQAQLVESEKGQRDARKSLRQERSRYLGQNGLTGPLPASCCSQLERELERLKEQLQECRWSESKAQRVAENVQQQLQIECSDLQRKLIQTEDAQAQACQNLAGVNGADAQVQKLLSAAYTELEAERQRSADETAELRRMVLDEQQHCNALKKQLAGASYTDQGRRRGDNAARTPPAKQPWSETPSTTSSIEGEQLQEDLQEETTKDVIATKQNVESVQLACQRLHAELAIAKGATGRADAAHADLKKIQRSLQEEHSTLKEELACSRTSQALSSKRLEEAFCKTKELTNQCDHVREELNQCQKKHNGLLEEGRAVQDKTCLLQQEHAELIGKLATARDAENSARLNSGEACSVVHRIQTECDAAREQVLATESSIEQVHQETEKWKVECACLQDKLSQAHEGTESARQASKEAQKKMFAVPAGPRKSESTA